MRSRILRILLIAFGVSLGVYFLFPPLGVWPLGITMWALVVAGATYLVKRVWQEREEGL